MSKTRPPPETISLLPLETIPLEVKKIALEQAERALRDTLENGHALDRKCVVCLSGLGAILLGVNAYIPSLISSGLLSDNPTEAWRSAMLIFGVLGGCGLIP